MKEECDRLRITPLEQSTVPLNIRGKPWDKSYWFADNSGQVDTLNIFLEVRPAWHYRLYNE